MSEPKNKKDSYENIPNQAILLDNLGKIAFTLDKAYLEKLDEYPIYDFDNYNTISSDKEKGCRVSLEDNIRALKIEKWVFNKDENPGECFKNVLNTFSDGKHTIGLLIKRTCNNTEMYFLIKNETADITVDSQEQTGTNLALLKAAIKGNFPGSKIEEVKIKEEDIASDNEKDVKDNESHQYLNDILSFEDENYNSVAVMTNIPSEFSEKHITQGIDKVLNGIVPEKGEYDILFLAESLSISKIREIISGYEDLASAITPYLQHQYQIGKNKLNTEGDNVSVTDSNSVSHTLSKTHSVNINGGIPHVASVGYGYNWGKSDSDTKSQSKTKGTNRSLSLGSSESSTYTYKSFLVSNIVDKLEKTIKRINEGTSIGVWNYAVYVLSDEASTSLNVANSLRAISQGKESYTEPAIVHCWIPDPNDNENKPNTFNNILKYLEHGVHPIFCGDDNLTFTPTSYVGADELGFVFSFPKSSLPGIPVLQGVQFGREPHSLLKTELDVEIGSGYHMHEKIESQRIKLSKDELTKHTFITGSTGSGKSNTVYSLINILDNEKINYLIIEPAKGEYKDVIGKRKNVNVYGTNPLMQDIKMLHINPFSFPPKTHILEHLDRLVEIFNVCWPMYAAMPAILKDAIERAYISCGWNIEQSTNPYNIYPSFSDVNKQVKIVLNESEYSDENKGDYIGSLVTRINSLTNGINGLIFSDSSIPDKALFDEKVIIDLSRIGSSETKSLIMGVLVLKLQEYRMENKVKSNEDKLEHITILEEAHNLLKRTSFEQLNESSNIIGKSVEMISNSIAEMRAYGEGFVIVDQSPGLMDMSVIRNTNTKIILRLPDFSDRELVGKASGLNDDQINEITKLEKGVAVVSQSDWLEPVLCKIDKYKYKSNSESNIPVSIPENLSTFSHKDDVLKSLVDCIMKKELYRKNDKIDIRKLKEDILKSNLCGTIKYDYLEYINGDKENGDKQLGKLIFDIFNSDEILDRAEKIKDIKQWRKYIINNLSPKVLNYSLASIDMLISYIIAEKQEKDSLFELRYNNFMNHYIRENYLNEMKVNRI